MADAAVGDLQKPHNDLTEEELNTLIAAAKIKRETAELKVRFPSHPAELVSRICVRQHKTQTIASRCAGGASFKGRGRETSISHGGIGEVLLKELGSCSDSIPRSNESELMEVLLGYQSARIWFVAEKKWEDVING